MINLRPGGRHRALEIAVSLSADEHGFASIDMRCWSADFDRAASWPSAVLVIDRSALSPLAGSQMYPDPTSVRT